MEDRKAFIVGISGASSSGKTTLARLLRDVFPSTFVLHEDDFYKPETELPTREGIADWDCAEAISIPDLARALSHIRAHGTFPHFVDSKEDQNSVGACPVPDASIAEARARVAAWLAPGQPGHGILSSGGGGGGGVVRAVASGSDADGSPPPPAQPEPEQQQQQQDGLRVCILDGFLLYSEEMEAGGVTPLLDAKLFLVVGRERAMQRRRARDGYVTLDGFWTDPPGYVEKVVWPNYAAAHARLFRGGDVDAGRLDDRALRDKGILAQTDRPDEPDMETTFRWAVDTLMRQLEEAGKRR